uniref:ribosomal protein S20 n=1 Tax=Gloiopeltis furcata TaxID=42017 RepID=UPI0028D1F3AE|nr:ribosomal protein S20 [Gloiopeltis furcata]WMP13889.1 ribosomal protein S20 [Gloiopeltis furcata]
MPKHSSALKKNQISIRNRRKNRISKSSIKTLTKKYLTTINNLNDLNCKNASDNLSSVYSVIDKAVKKGILHKNNGARRKALLASRMKRAVNL